MYFVVTHTRMCATDNVYLNACIVIYQTGICSMLTWHMCVDEITCTGQSVLSCTKLRIVYVSCMHPVNLCERHIYMK